MPLVGLLSSLQQLLPASLSRHRRLRGPLQHSRPQSGTRLRWLLLLLLLSTLILTAIAVYYTSSTPPAAGAETATNHAFPPSALDLAWPASQYDRPTSSFASPLTLTTAYFPFKSKHSASNYSLWLSNFLSFNRAPMVVFTSADYYPTLAAIRYACLFPAAAADSFPLSTANALHTVDAELSAGESLTSYPTHWVLTFSSPQEIPLIASMSSVFTSQLRIDPEAERHSPLLYAQWTAKLFMLNYSASLNPFNSKYHQWADAGQFRQQQRRVSHYPDTARLAAVFAEASLPTSPPFPRFDPAAHPHPSSAPVSSRHHKLLMTAAYPFSAAFCAAFDPLASLPASVTFDHIAGQSFLGTARAVQWYTALYYQLAAAFITNGWLVGKDQTLHNAAVFGLKGSFLLLGAWKVRGEEQCWLGVGWDGWWSFAGAFLAREEDALPGCRRERYDVKAMVRDAQSVCEEGSGNGDDAESWMQAKDEWRSGRIVQKITP